MGRSLYISVLVALLVLLAISIYIDLSMAGGIRKTRDLSSSEGSSQTSQESSWSTVCLRINMVDAKLYYADTPSKWGEGYMYKNSTDFLNAGAVGMLFRFPVTPGSAVTFTMANVAFPLYLLRISPIEGVGDVAKEIVYMEPEKNYSVSVETPNDYFIELDPAFFLYVKKTGTDMNSTLIRITGTC